MRGVVLSLSQELKQVRQARNRLDGRRAELQMALGAEKLRRAFGVAGGSGANAAAAADVFEGFFKRWRLACLEGKQGRLKRESEENRGKAESYQARLSVRRTLLLLFVVYLTLTDPLRIQPWSQDKDRQNQNKSNREHVPRKKAGKQTFFCFKSGRESSWQNSKRS